MRHHFWLIVLLLLVMPGCSTMFQAKRTTPVESVHVTGGYAVIEEEVGLLYDYFRDYNAWTDAEEIQAETAYRGIIGLITKLQKKTVAGKVDYHRLLYFTEDFTEYWEDLKVPLDAHVAAELPGRNEYAEALYLRIRRDVDNMLELSNVRLRYAEGEMDKATYEQFRTDAQNIIKTISPLIQKGIDIIL